MNEANDLYWTEETLSGGYTNTVVRIGSTVRRQLGPRSDFVHELLELFETTGLDGAPRFLGVDGQGREMLTYVEGYCPHDGADLSLQRSRLMDGVFSDGSLIEVFKMLRRFHDATAGTELAGDHEVVLYGDPAPRNTIYRDGVPVAFIDWDLAKPGRRIRDVAQGMWQWLDMGSIENRNLAELQRRVRLLADAYELDDRAELIEEILSVQTEVIDDLRRQLKGDVQITHRDADKALASVERERKWLAENQPALEGALA